MFLRVQIKKKKEIFEFTTRSSKPSNHLNDIYVNFQRQFIFYRLIIF